MLIIDGHEDLAWNALELGRDETARSRKFASGKARIPPMGKAPRP